VGGGSRRGALEKKNLHERAFLPKK
jgi:hypothetical protein